MSSFICSSRTISQHNGHDRMSYPSAHAMWEPFPCMPAKNYRVPNYKLHETITIHSKTFTTWAQLTLTIIRHGIHNNKTVNASDFSIIENMKRNYFFHKGRLEIQSQFVEEPPPCPSLLQVPPLPIPFWPVSSTAITNSNAHRDP